MLDAFTIATKGGLVLWSQVFSPIHSDPVDDLLRNVLVEERAGLHTYTTGQHALHWTFANDLDLIFIVVYQKILQLKYIEDLLSSAKTLFCDTFLENLRDSSRLHSYVSFTDTFDNLLHFFEKKDAQEKKVKVPRAFKDTKKGQSLSEENEKPREKQGVQAEEEPAPHKKNPMPVQRRHGRGGKIQPNTKSSTTETPAPQRSQKKKTVWGADGSMIEVDGDLVLDYSNQDHTENDVNVETLIDREAFGSKAKDGTYEVADFSALLEKPSTNGKPKEESGLISFFRNVTGQKIVSTTNLAPVLSQMKEHLINKNVAADIAQHLCDSVAQGIMGQKVGTFETIYSAVKRSMEQALKSILTPKTSVDLLRDIAAAQSQKRPYTMAFIGVNGVGKSTNLSKTCFWLLQNNLRVLIAACDTFRSGAVEQLRVHARNLQALSPQANVELFERGYGKDAAGIAKEAVSYAKNNGFDVVLIDTAGRMQDNEPLMRSLAKLVSVNSPDKIIFVGEALVGNEAIDQLKKFNQALKDFSGKANPRHIDGMILTKFDTIDDKVGAALSMTYTTGQPILFVGTGQTYTDLKTMRIEHIVQSLLRT